MVVLRIDTVDYVTLFANRQPDDNLDNITYQLEHQTVIVDGKILKNGETIITTEQSANRLMATYNPVVKHVTDVTLPTLVTAVIGTGGNSVFLTFSEIINVNSWLVAGFFTLTVSGVTVQLTFAGGYGTHHLNFSIGHTVFQGETATLAYTPGDVADLSGNQLAAFSGFPVTNTSTQQRVVPVIESFVVDSYVGSTIGITFSKPVTGGATGFSVTASDGVLNITYAGGSGTAVWTYTTSRIVGSHETLTYSYDVSAAIKDADNNLLAAVTNQPVTNGSPADTIDPLLESATIAANGETLTLVFSEAVSGTFGSPSVAADLGGTGITATYVSGNATNTHTYTIFRRALSGEAVTITGGGLVDGSGNTIPAFTDLAVTNNSAVELGATVETFNSSTTWSCPADIYVARVEIWGGGGGGGGHSFSSGGGGGGGGAYSMMVCGVVPEDDYVVTVGSAGSAGSTFSSGGTGGDSTFRNQSFTLIVVVKGGSGGSGFSSGGAGGQLFGNGDVRFIGGTGGNATSSSLGGGGGGAAGSNANGGNGSGATAGTAGTGGGNGGAGGNNGAGTAGTAPGGGGGGSGNSSNNGGAGAAGRITITY